MDFEEQLERAEILPSPSLTGSSVRSADDSPHNNYIHPEKYSSLRDPSRHERPKLKSKLSSSVTASLDDLISEGALMGSDEDFEKFLDPQGHIKHDAIYDKKSDKKLSDKKLSEKKLSKKKSSHKKSSPGSDKKLPLAQDPLTVSSSADTSTAKDDEKDLAEEEPTAEGKESKKKAPTSDQESLQPAPALGSGTSAITTSASVSSVSDAPAASGNSVYATPNLSEYQLSNQLSSHQDLISSLRSDDYHQLPKFEPPADDHASIESPSSPVRSARAIAMGLRSRSRSRSAASTSRRTHLARGDNYKSTHPDDPHQYELPPTYPPSPENEHADTATGPKDEDENDQEDRGRQLRQSKPTMGEKIARAEAATEPVHVPTSSREPSLVTLGDYCNFNVDTPSRDFKPNESLYTTRTESATNYLRSISRSRSRAPPKDSEKNDASAKDLKKEGSLLADEPYPKVPNLDTMVEEVLHGDSAKTVTSDEVAGKDVIKPKEGEGKVPPKPKEEGADKAATGDAAPKEIKSEQVSATEKSDKSADKELATVKKDADKEPATAKDDIKDSESDLKKPLTKSSADLEKVVETSVGTSLSSVEDKTLTETEGAKTGDKDANADDKVAKTDDKDATTGDKDSKTGDEHAKTGDKDSKTGDESAKTGDKDVNTGVKDAKTGDKDAKTDDKDVKTDDKDAAIDDKDAKASDKGAKTGDRNITTGDKNATTGDKNAKETDAKDSKLVDDKDSTKTLEDTCTPSEKEAPASGAEKPIDKGLAACEAVPATKAVPTVQDDDEEFDVSPEEIRKHLMSQPVYIYTSLAGGMRITQKANRLATILNANEVKFTYRDLGTDPEAKKTWQRQANGRALPGVVRGDDLIGNFQEIDEANEEGRVETLLYETL